MSALEIDFPNPAEVNPFTDINGYIWDYDGVTWVRQTQGILKEAPVDGEQYARKDGVWAVVTHPDAEVPEAPLTVGKTYVRGEAQWWEVTVGLGGITDAPADGTVYGRKDSVWSVINIADFPDFQTEFDKKANVDHTHETDDFVDGVGTPIVVVEEAPVNGKEYVRKDAGWVENVPLNATVYSKAITIIRPQVEDDGTLFFSSVAFTIEKLFAHIAGEAGSQVTVNIYFSSTRDGVPTKVFNVDKVINSAAGEELTGVDITNIPVNSWIWLEVVTVTGDPLMFHLSLEYKLQ